MLSLAMPAKQLSNFHLTQLLSAAMHAVNASLQNLAAEGMALQGGEC